MILMYNLNLVLKRTLFLIVMQNEVVFGETLKMQKLSIVVKK